MKNHNIVFVVQYYDFLNYYNIVFISHSVKVHVII